MVDTLDLGSSAFGRAGSNPASRTPSLCREFFIGGGHTEAMTATVTKLEDNKIRLDVEVPPEAVREGVEAKVRELGRQVRVPGFRPGKAPRRVIENHLGRDYIYYGGPAGQAADLVLGGRGRDRPSGR